MSRRFAFSLARELGIWDVDAMMKAMSSKLLSEWMAFFINEDENVKKDSLIRQAKQGIDRMKIEKEAKRRR